MTVIIDLHCMHAWSCGSHIAGCWREIGHGPTMTLELPPSGMFPEGWGGAERVAALIGPTNASLDRLFLARDTGDPIRQESYRPMNMRQRGS